MIVLLAFGLCALTAATSSRIIDPMTTVIARDMGLPITTVALLSSAYAIPFALGQPLLGPIGDSWGKARLLKTCLAVLAICLTLCALAPSFEILMVLRFAAGLAAGGVVPSSMAMIGDRFTGSDRQIAVGRLVAIALIGQVMSASLAGLLGDRVSWRLPLAMAAAISVAGLIAALRYIDEPNAGPSKRPSISGAVAGYRQVFANPRAYICYGTVFLEGLWFFGAMPFIAPILEQTGRGGATEAGLVLGCFGLGGIVFTLSLPFILPRVGRTAMLGSGGLVAGSGLAGLALGLPWPAVAALFVASGIGFMMLHNSVQTESLDLAPNARSSAYAAHAFFFFVGQALGPPTYGALLHHGGPATALVSAIVVLTATGVASAILFASLAHRKSV